MILRLQWTLILHISISRCHVLYFKMHVFRLSAVISHLFVATVFQTLDSGCVLKTAFAYHEHESLLSSSQLCSGGQLVPFLEDRKKGPVHPHLRGERRWEDRGLQEDPAVLRRHVSGQRAGSDGQRPPAAVQPCAGGEQLSYLLGDELQNINASSMNVALSLLE